jgi:hypothetical protein
MGVLVPVAACRKRVSLTPEQLQQRGRIAALVRAARDPDPSAHGRNGQVGLLRRFEREIDPDGVMDPAERARRADQARRAHMLRLALRSSRVRQARKRGEAQT